jgi:hypothetical protein
MVEDISCLWLPTTNTPVRCANDLQNYAIAELDVWEASDTDDTSAPLTYRVTWIVTARKDGLWNWWNAVRKSHKHAAYRGKLWSTAKTRLAALRLRAQLQQ